MTQVPFLSLREQTLSLKPELLSALEGVLDSQGFANGPAVAQLETELAAFLGVKHVVAVNTGTTALHAALLCAGVGPGDDVVTVAHTWISTAWAVSYVGARPVFAEIEAATCGMDPADLARRITPRTKAIIPVHLYGQPVRLDGILEVAQKHGIPVIEDCAQSVGALYRGKHTGSFGLVNATSFYPGKNLGALGEGGAVMTNDDAIAARARCLRDHAQSGRHNHVEIGFNWRMDGFQGAALSVKLRYLAGWNERRRQIAAQYRAGLSGLATQGLSLLPENDWSTPIWHIFPVFHAKRDALRAALEAKGVQTGVHYPRPVHLQPAYASLGLAAGAYPISERLAATEASLPMFPELTDDAVQYVIAQVNAVCRELA
jgi:dTDP-4-amino-4,6-dideoxygalactose transaminase